MMCARCGPPSSDMDSFAHSLVNSSKGIVVMFIVLEATWTISHEHNAHSHTQYPFGWFWKFKSFIMHVMLYCHAWLTIFEINSMQVCLFVFERFSSIVIRKNTWRLHLNLTTQKVTTFPIQWCKIILGPNIELCRRCWHLLIFKKDSMEVDIAIEALELTL